MVQDYVNQVGNRIVSSLSSRVFSYHFYVIKQDVYNAFASPAGHIFVNSGLLAAMENEEELAGILALKSPMCFAGIFLSGSNGQRKSVSRPWPD